MLTFSVEGEINRIGTSLLSAVLLMNFLVGIYSRRFTRWRNLYAAACSLSHRGT